MVQFLSIKFFCWISSIFVRVFKSSCFFVSPCICTFLWEQLTTVQEIPVPRTETSFVSLSSVFGGVSRLPLHPVVRCEYFVFCPFITGISQQDYRFLCRLLTEYTNLKDFWSSDLSSLREGFLNGSLFYVSWRTARTTDVTTAFSRHSDVCGWLRTARHWRPAIVLPDKQMYQQCSLHQKLFFV